MIRFSLFLIALIIALNIAAYHYGWILADWVKGVYRKLMK